MAGELTARERARLERIRGTAAELARLERRLERELRGARRAGHSIRTLAGATGIDRSTLQRRLQNGGSPDVS
jgi:DNA invertase Pin-like site-specific DNA recombinase